MIGKARDKNGTLLGRAGVVLEDTKVVQAQKMKEIQAERAARVVPGMARVVPQIQDKNLFTRARHESCHFWHESCRDISALFSFTRARHESCHFWHESCRALKSESWSSPLLSFDLFALVLCLVLLIHLRVF